MPLIIHCCILSSCMYFNTSYFFFQYWGLVLGTLLSVSSAVPALFIYLFLRQVLLCSQGRPQTWILLPHPFQVLGLQAPVTIPGLFVYFET